MASYTGAFVNNKWCCDDELTSIAVLDPSTGEECGSVSACKAKEADAALVAAAAAAPVWGGMPIGKRAECIAAYKSKLIENKDSIVALLVKETGKVTGNADYDFTMLVDCLSFHVEEARRAYGQVIPSPDDSTLSYLRHTPVGVVVAVLTWNFPLLNLGYKLGPILASGCTCVVKPSEMTPLATSMAIGLLADCDFPAGVVNVVNGTGLDLIEPLCASTIPRLLTCIGSTVMGRRMISYSHTSIKRFSLELGGDAPVLIFADCTDLDAVIADVIGLKFANGGQICVSPNRVYVEESIYPAFLEKAKALIAKYDYGSGDDHAPKEEVLQALVSESSLERCVAMVANAKAAGAEVTGGERVDRKGFFMQPTLVAGATDDMTCQCEEIFGPILPVRSFKSSDEAFTMANKSELGLSSYVYTGSLDTMLRAENELMTGNVCINGAHYSIELPHGGLKQSGYGKDISNVSLRDYMDIRRISVKRKR